MFSILSVILAIPQLYLIFPISRVSKIYFIEQNRLLSVSNMLN